MESKAWSKIFLIILVFYILFSVSKVLYQSYQVNKEVSSLKDEIKGLQEINKLNSDKLLYYQSPTYREKIARERLGLQKPGEEVVVILPEERPKETKKEEEKLANYIKWWNYFFQKD